MLYGFITIWFSVGCRVALELGFCMLFKVICLRECNVFSGWGNASRQVNELLAKKDRIIERQSNKWTRFFWVTKLRVDKLTSGQVNELFVLICWPMHSKTRHKNVLMLLCLLFTLSFIYPVYQQLVNSALIKSSTQHKKWRKNSNRLFFQYFLLLLYLSIIYALWT